VVARTLLRTIRANPIHYGIIHPRGNQSINAPRYRLDNINPISPPAAPSRSPEETNPTTTPRKAVINKLPGPTLKAAQG
jgi:hypothetical protein